MSDLMLLNADQKKKIGHGHLKNSGERSMAILALLFQVFFVEYFEDNKASLTLKL